MQNIDVERKIEGIVICDLVDEIVKKIHDELHCKIEKIIEKEKICLSSFIEILITGITIYLIEKYKIQSASIAEDKKDISEFLRNVEENIIQYFDTNQFLYFKEKNVTNN